MRCGAAVCRTRSDLAEVVRKHSAASVSNYCSGFHSQLKILYLGASEASFDAHKSQRGYCSRFREVHQVIENVAAGDAEGNAA